MLLIKVMIKVMINRIIVKKKNKKTLVENSYYFNYQKNSMIQKVQYNMLNKFKKKNKPKKRKKQ